MILGILSAILYLNFMDPLSWNARFFHAGLALILVIMAVFIPGWAYFRASNNIPVPYKVFLHILSVCCIGWCILLEFEVFFRLFPIYDTAAVNPGVHYFRTGRPWNRLGHKDREFSLYHAPTHFRILAVGDSYTEGVGVALSETFSSVLERSLNRRIKEFLPTLSVEVYNLGHSGRNTEQEINLILQESPLLTPDLIVLAYVLNDAEQHPDPLMMAATPWWLRWNALNDFFFNSVKSYAYYWFFIQSSRRMNSIDIYSAQHDIHYEGWKTVEESLNRYQTYLNKTHVTDISVVFPLFISGEYPPQLQAIHTQVIQAFRQRELHAIDLLPLFQSRNTPLERFCFSPHDRHPNQEAHALVGNFLADAIFQSQTFQQFITLHLNTDTLPLMSEKPLEGKYGPKELEWALALINKKEYSTALQLLDTIIAEFEQTVIPQNLPYISTWTKEEYENYVKAAQLENILWINGTYKEAYLLKAQIAMEFQQFEQACTFIEKALSVSPNDPIAYGLRGNIFHAENKIREALYEYQAAYKFSMKYTYQQPNQAILLQYISAAYRGLGDLTRAQLAYDELSNYRE